MATAPNDSVFWKKWFDDVLLQLKQTNDNMGEMFSKLHKLDIRMTVIETEAKPNNKLTVVVAAAIPSIIFAVMWWLK